MSEDSNPYAAVLADLEKERDQITGMIAMIKRRMGLSSEESTPAPTSANNSVSSHENAEIRSDTFFGLSISEAIKKYLAMVKRPQRATDIAKALDEGGLLHSSKSWQATVQTTLTRMKGVVVRVPNGWGLMEWYPGRNFEKTAKPAPPKKKVRPKKKVSVEAKKKSPPKTTSEPSVSDKENPAA